MARYNFNDYLTLELATSHRGYRRYFENEYLRIARADPEARTPVTIRVEIVRRLPEQRTGDVVRHTRYKKLFTYRSLIRGLATDQVTIYFAQHWVDRVYMNAIGVFLQAQVLEPVMYLKLLEHGVLLMHAAGVSKEGTAVVLPAYGGTGKTTLSIGLLAQGYRFLGDDLLLVDSATLEVHPYPRPLHIFTYNVRSLVGASIPLKYRAAVHAKNIIRVPLERVLRTEFLISTRIHADEIFSGEIFGERAPIGAIAFLRKDGPAFSVVPTGADNAAELARTIAESADLNESLVDLVQGDPELVGQLRELESSVISRLLLSTGQLTHVNTRVLTDDDRAHFLERVRGTA